jgi:hypothetical protein
MIAHVLEHGQDLQISPVAVGDGASLRIGGIVEIRQLQRSARAGRGEVGVERRGVDLVAGFERDDADPRRKSPRTGL